MQFELHTNFPQKAYTKILFPNRPDGVEVENDSIGFNPHLPASWLTPSRQKRFELATTNQYVIMAQPRSFGPIVVNVLCFQNQVLIGKPGTFLVNQNLFMCGMNVDQFGTCSTVSILIGECCCHQFFNPVVKGRHTSCKINFDISSFSKFYLKKPFSEKKFKKYFLTVVFSIFE